MFHPLPPCQLFPTCIPYTHQLITITRPYVSEIFPTRLREPGIAIGVASQWLFSFIYTLTNPYMVANLKYGTLFFWGAANLCIAVISYFLIRETQGLSLEEINAVCDDFSYVFRGKGR